MAHFANQMKGCSLPRAAPGSAIRLYVSSTLISVHYNQTYTVERLIVFGFRYSYISLGTNIRLEEGKSCHIIYVTKSSISPYRSADAGQNDGDSMNSLNENLGQKPLVPLLDPDDFTPGYRETVEKVRSRTGHISNSARATAHGEELAAATRHFLESTWILGDLPREFRALIRYKVSTTNTCFYCSAHQLGYLKKMGIGEEKIRNINEFAQHPAFDDRERAALAFAEAMTRDASNIPDDTADNFVAHFSPKERIEIAIVAAGMGMLNKLNDSLRIPVDDSSLDIAAALPEYAREFSD